MLKSMRQDISRLGRRAQVQTYPEDSWNDAVVIIKSVQPVLSGCYATFTILNGTLEGEGHSNLRLHTGDRCICKTQDGKIYLFPDVVSGTSSESSTSTGITAHSHQGLSDGGILPTWYGSF